MNNTFHALPKETELQRTPIHLVEPLIRDALDTASYLQEKLGVDIGTAQAMCLNMVEDNYNIDLEAIYPLLDRAIQPAGNGGAAKEKETMHGVNFADLGLNEETINMCGNNMRDFYNLLLGVLKEHPYLTTVTDGQGNYYIGLSYSKNVPWKGLTRKHVMKEIKRVLTPYLENPNQHLEADLIVV